MNSSTNASLQSAAAAATTLFLGLSLTCFPGISPAQADEEPASAGSRYATEVTNMLQPLIQEYGPDAVNLQGNLMRYAIDNGALVETTVGISGKVQRQQRTYLVFTMNSGIVYRGSDATASARPARIWNDIILPSIRHCKRLNIEADGLEIRSMYRHVEFDDRADLARKLRDGAGSTETATFRILSADVIDLAHDRISSQELLSRAQVEVNGSRTQLQIPAPSDPPR